MQVDFSITTPEFDPKARGTLFAPSDAFEAPSAVFEANIEANTGKGKVEVNVCPASFSLYPESNGTTTLNNSTLALSGLPLTSPMNLQEFCAARASSLERYMQAMAPPPSSPIVVAAEIAQLHTMRTESACSAAAEELSVYQIIFKFHDVDTRLGEELSRWVEGEAANSGRRRRLFTTFELGPPHVDWDWESLLGGHTGHVRAGDALEELAYRVLLASGPYIECAKTHFNRPRPHQCDTSLEPCIEEPPYAAYPSGHATQAELMAQLYSRLNPARATAYATLARDIARRREEVGLHFASDTTAGEAFGQALFLDVLHSVCEFTAARARESSAAGTKLLMNDDEPYDQAVMMLCERLLPALAGS